MGPTKHPSAWRLNKAEEKSVDGDLAVWEASLPVGLSQEETLLKRRERKRLVRVIQEAKHEASLQKQHAAGAKTKAKAGQKPSAASESQAPVAAETSTTTTSTNSEYYECVKQDMAVIEKVLGSKLKELMPTPIAATMNEKTGVQVHFS